MTDTLIEVGRSMDISPVFQNRRKKMGMSDRIDPFYEIEWLDALATKWSSISVARISYGIDELGTVSPSKDMVFSPIESVDSKVYTPIGIRCVASLVQFHQLTTYQLACLIDVRPLDINNAMKDLYAYGVVENASPTWMKREIYGRTNGGSGFVWRLSNSIERLEKWMRKLTDLESKLVSQGRDIAVGTNSSRSGSSIRHNLAASELILRAMESCPSVIGAWGETATRGSLFVEESIRKRSNIRDNIGDAAIVTKDGGIIILETSGASNLDDKGGDKIRDKATAWATIAALSEQDIKVVFVNINSSARMNRFEWRVIQGLDAIGKNITNTALQKKGVNSIFTANAYDWFPMPMTVSGGFSTLQSFSPSRKKYFELAPLDIRFNVESDALINTIAALHVPPWVFKRVTSSLGAS